MMILYSGQDLLNNKYRVLGEQWLLNNIHKNISMKNNGRVSDQL